MDVENTQAAQRQAAFCRVFGNSKRILIAWALVDQELTVSQISAAIGATLPNTSQHLHLMKASGIVESRREGQTIYYRLANNERLAICGLFTQAKKESNHDNNGFN